MNTLKKTRRRLFGWQLVSLLGLFVVLGIIITLIYQNTVFTNVNKSLDKTSEMILKSPKDKRDIPEGSPIAPTDEGLKRGTPTGGPPAAFRTNTVVLDDQGKILNADQLGSRLYGYFKTLELDTATLNQKQSLTTTSGTFRTLLIKVPASNANPLYAGHYVLILQNIDAELDAVNSFRYALIVTLAIFWLLALGLAYLLARRGMRPIITAWQHQQDFVADAAHELRAPLAVIQSQQESLLTKPNAKVIDASEAIATSLAETKRLRHLTDDLLVIAQSDSDALVLSLEKSSLQDIFAEVLAPYQELALSQGKTLTIDLPEQTEQVTADAERLQQLVVILLDNALKYTESGDAIWVDVKPQRDQWQLIVGNSGQSISKTAQAHIFERFYREDASRNRQTGGSGLGLSIAEWIVHAHRGKISVADYLPHGVVFTAIFPRGK